MPGFTTQVPHPMTQEEAVEKLKSFVAGVRDRYKEMASSVDGEWQENVLTFKIVAMSMTIEGGITVEEKLAVIKVTYPLAASFFAGKIEESIKGEVAKALA